MARLIRTEKEVEGRFEEVWLVVEEDALDAVAGRAARDRRASDTARDGAHARTGRGPVHVGLAACPGCCTPRFSGLRTRVHA